VDVTTLKVYSTSVLDNETLSIVGSYLADLSSILIKIVIINDDDI
jgi:hypothetical protein